ncbi:glycosyltransferase [Falsiroseomonas selenitidurans]|uniref:Glycosyltransferase n=1 Tax=Falsiroseomonas selenitidurans TaxID=2716335 RepID=A0ABX1E9C3_9PROT|nr:glycosyltransferase [Falsiroseomonas selenitidurans]NKC33375.1 glycosyltransferase [Falsiroseomonas selenitidurans]
MPAAANPTGGRRILILDCDLFGQVGGGQAVFRRMMALQPGDSWFYFRRAEEAAAPRPANAQAIPLVEPLLALPQEAPANLHHFLWVWRIARNMARSVALHLGRVDFDVVDVPDYTQLGPFIRLALAAEGCRADRVVLSLHGTLSDAFRGGWPTGQDERRILAELRLREHLQFRAAEARYALSDHYAAAWQRRIPAPVNRLDPLVVIGTPDPRPADRTAGAPDLAFIGRREKWKGPDIFLDAAWGLDPDSYRRLLLVGPDGPNRLGQGGDALLAAAARRRGLEGRLELAGAMPREDVRALLRGRSLLLLPSRHDTFNLTALEALALGCPTLVSEHAGVASWLRGRLPGLGWAVVPIDCARGAAAAAATVLADYDRHRDAVAEAWQRAALQPDARGVAHLHEVAAAPDVRAQQAAIEITAQLSGALIEALPPGPRQRAVRRLQAGGAALGGGLVQGLRRAHRVVPVKRGLRRAWRLLPAPLRTEALDVAGRVGAVLATPASHSRRAAALGQLDEAIRLRGGFEAFAYGQVRGLCGGPGLRAQLAGMPERGAEEVAAKLRVLTRAVAERRTDRVPLFREMARLERRAGNPLNAATYLLRTLRWLGADPRGDLPFIAATLRAHGFVHEAATAEAMFDGAADGPARCLDLMREARERNRHKPELPLAVLDDRRDPGARPRACVIASLYNAADKLPTLLGMLARQSLATRGELEVVLVDSNSPSDEQGAFAAFAAAQPDLPICYGRSAARETIQAAWNRGIRLSRAPYLAFLGADEGLHPDALRRLADALDQDAAADWAMADSIVTNVDRQGIYESDIMAYDRSGYRQDLVYLETCYLSWVGALYRRSIHDRFGWYDESFRAAGDTEFKNRLMPRIRSIHVPAPLGIFNNYPEERTTQHPRAEIEDLRAWYLWRTPAGMDHAFAQRAPDAAMALLRDCLGYRKSYCGHLSTDYDLAASLADHLLRREDRPPEAAAAWQEMRRALALIRGFEDVPEDLRRPGPAIARRVWGIDQLRAARALARRQQERLGLPAPPPFQVFNDNRYEQHWWSWSVG